MSDKVKLGISACLLGEKVRFDGGHKLDHYLAETLGPFLDWVPVCPETEAGFGIPREPMRLEDDAGIPRLVGRTSGIDQTPAMEKWARRRLRGLGKAGLRGFVFKSRSPSCGTRRVPVVRAGGRAACGGRGIWARAFIDAYPLVPFEDEDRLRGAGARENFIDRIFVYDRWLRLTERRPTAGALVDFHSDHKYLLMAHSPEGLRELGRIVGESGVRKPAELYAAYLPQLMKTLKLKVTVRKNVNVLMHIVGHLKKNLSPDEKRELLVAIEEYQQQLAPLVVPVTLIRHYVRKYGEPYLSRQYYLNPHPAELILRNHA